VVTHQLKVKRMARERPPIKDRRSSTELDRPTKVRNNTQ